MIYGTVNSPHAADNYRTVFHKGGSVMTAGVSVSFVVAYVLVTEESSELPLGGLAMVSVALFGLIMHTSVPPKSGGDVAFSGVVVKDNASTLSRLSTSEGPPVF